MAAQCSVVPLSELEAFSRRADAEYYRPAFIEMERSLKCNKWSYLEDLSDSIKSFGAYSLCNQIEYREDGIPFLRATDIKDGHVDFSGALRIDSDTHQLLWKSQIEPETVLLTMSGTVGNSTVTNGAMPYPINSSQDVAKVITGSSLNPYCLSAFLQSHYGRMQTARLPIGSVQQHVFLWQINKLIIPEFSRPFQSEIANAFKAGQSARQQAGAVYDLAQEILLSELNLADWQPQHHVESVRNFSEVWSAGRIDAEYYQPKYYEVVNAVKGYRGGWDTLGNLVNLKGVNFPPDDATEYRYIELANIAGNGEITDCTVGLGADLPSRARRKVSAGDVIVSSIEGSLDSIALIDSQYDGALCSTGFHVINSQAFNTETLLVLLKSAVGQLQLKKGCSGTILTAINKDEFSRIVLPKIAEGTQAEIRQKVAESAALRRQSRRLLESAKRAVEIAIEEDEGTAMAWLEGEREGITR